MNQPLPSRSPVRSLGPPRPWSHLLAPALLLAALLVPLLAPSSVGLPGTAGLAWQVLATAAGGAGVWLMVRLIDVVLWERVLPRAAGLRIPRLLRQLAALLVSVLVVALLLGNVWRLSIGPLLAATGAIGIVLGLALRNVLADFFSGIALNVEQPFHLDDFVLLHIRGKREPVAGFVREINWRSTTVLTPEDNLISVPNSLVAASTVENLSFPSPVYELELDILLHWQLPAPLVERVLGAAMVDAWARGATSGDKAPKTRICRLDGAGVTWRVVYLIDPRRKPKGPARHQLLACVHQHLRMAGLQPVHAEPAGLTAPPQRPWLPEDAADREQQLALVPLFAPLQADECRQLAQSVQPLRLRAGDVVVRMGEPGDSLFVPVAGVLEVRRPDVGEGQPPRVGVLSPGDAFGEMSLLTGQPRSATVAALTEAVLLRVDRDVLAPLLVARPALADTLAAMVAAHQQRDAAADAATPEPGTAPRAGLAASIREAMRRLLAA